MIDRTTAYDALLPILEKQYSGCDQMDDMIGRMNAVIDYFAAPANQHQRRSFQQRVNPWMTACFGVEIATNTAERNHRFLEEALELVQACGCTTLEAHQLVEYVFGRPLGEKNQEVGGVMVTLAALCLAQELDMHSAGETELARIWTKVDQIRAKQAAKPPHSPLPEVAAPASPWVRVSERLPAFGEVVFCFVRPADTYHVVTFLGGEGEAGAKFRVSAGLCVGEVEYWMQIPPTNTLTGQTKGEQHV